MERIKIGVFDKFIEIIPIENTYFVSVDKPKTRLTKQLVTMNYAAMSIYKNSDLTFCVDRNKLYVWFYEKSISKKKLIIPEGYLWFKLYKEKKNVILEIEKTANIVFLAIKDGFLITQIIKTKNTDRDNFVNLLQKKYHIDVKPIKPETDVTLSALALSDIFRFINPDAIHFNNLFNQAVEFLKLPLIAVFFLVSIGNIAYYSHVKSTLQSKNAYLMELKKKNSDIKQKFRYLEKQQQLWKMFEENDMRYPAMFKCLNTIAMVLLKYKGHINMFRASNDRIDIWISSDSSSSLVKNLMKTGNFLNVSVINVVQTHSGEIAQLGLKLRPLW